MTKIMDGILHIAGGLFVSKHNDGVKLYTTREETPFGRETACWGLSGADIAELATFLADIAAEPETPADDEPVAVPDADSGDDAPKKATKKTTKKSK